ncbi:hypothetical protein B0T20DRAFT_490620 [Sordaria brevicollis]|uniref:Uncharacterized protein n=1 Tax=Sordaria brevicollis TaxID=83679 RepID=A0AAE0NVM7_SORBR|nr:hypothetical protein B0T20DRAFT_490620 [Sordaria brevicollis]
MDPARNITQRMEDLAINPNAHGVARPHPTAMESTQCITQEMEDMTLGPAVRAITQSPATASSHVPSVFSQHQPQSISSFATTTTSGTTGGNTYGTTPTGLDFSNPTASSSGGLSNFDGSSASRPVPPTFSHHPLRRIAGDNNNRISKPSSHSYSSVHERHHRDRRQQLISAPISSASTSAHIAQIKWLPTATLDIFEGEEDADAKEVNRRQKADFLMSRFRRSQAAREKSIAKKRAEVARREKLFEHWNTVMSMSPSLKETLDKWRRGTDIRVYGGETEDEEDVQGPEHTMPSMEESTGDDMMTD